MKTAGIIAEYNPFHNGHKYHIRRTCEQTGADHLVCVMSGDFVQRGDIAVVDKFDRARTALENGVDLVLELPAQYALGSAQRFASAAAGMLDMLGCVDILSFGSECGDVDVLLNAARASDNADKDSISRYIKDGLNYPAALSKALYDAGCDEKTLAALASPNDILAAEYLRALSALSSDITPLAVKRTGAGHDGDDGENGFLSAMEIRRRISAGLDVSEFMPYNINKDTADISRLETAILAKLRELTPEDISALPDVNNGAQNRIYRAIRESTSLDTLYAAIKSKSSTLSKARRLVLCAFLGVTRDIADCPPAYIRVLGMNGRGKEILAASSCPIPIDTSLFALSQKSPAAKRQAALQSYARDLYALAFEPKKPCGGDYTAKPVILP